MIFTVDMILTVDMLYTVDMGIRGLRGLWVTSRAGTRQLND